MTYTATIRVIHRIYRCAGYFAHPFGFSIEDLMKINSDELSIPYRDEEGQVATIQAPRMGLQEQAWQRPNPLP